MLQARDVFKNYEAATLKNGLSILAEGEKAPLPYLQPHAIVTEKRRQD